MAEDQNNGVRENLGGGPPYGDSTQAQPQANFAPNREEMRARDAAYEQSRIDHDAEEARLRFAHSMEVASAQNDKDIAEGKPHIDRNAFPAVVKIYNEEFPHLKRDIENAYHDAPNRAWVKADVDEAKRASRERMDHKLNGVKDGRKAIMESEQANNNDGIVTQAVKKVYDSDRGGIQIGGLLGLLAGGGLAYMFTSGAGMLVNILATVAGAAVFAYAGDKFLDKPAPEPKLPDFHSGAPRMDRKGPSQVAEHTPHKNMQEILDNNSSLQNMAFGSQPQAGDNLTPGRTPAATPQTGKSSPKMMT